MITGLKQSKVMNVGYQRFVAVLFFSSTVISIFSVNAVNVPLWILCAYLYTFALEDSSTLISRIVLSINHLILLLGYLLLAYQIMVY